MKIVRWLLYLLGAFIVLGIVGNLIGGGSVSPSRSVEVLMVRDVDQLRFTNDSDVPLHNCQVSIDGYSAILSELPARGRKELGRLRFNDPLPQDEFLKRTRRMSMLCYDDANEQVAIELK
jgi:hypothetical protein